MYILDLLVFITPVVEGIYDEEEEMNFCVFQLNSSITCAKLLSLINRHVYPELFQEMGWGLVGALAEGGQELPEYHLTLQDRLQVHGISLVVRRKFLNNTRTPDIPQVSLCCLIIYLLLPHSQAA